jgi:hypothetical protein
MKLTRQKIRRIILQEMMHSEPNYDDSPRPSETDSDEDMFEFAYEQHADDMISDAIDNELFVYDPTRKVFGLPLGEYDDTTGYNVYDNTDENKPLVYDPEQLLQDILMQDFLRDTYSDSYDDSRLEQIASDYEAEKEYDQELSRYNYDDNY